MYVYAGIDEAGYGPLLGPLLVGRFTLAIPRLSRRDLAEPPQLWQRLSKVVCRSASDSNGRILVNDSKKLKSKAAGISHLERGILAFAAVGGHQPAHLGRWLDILGETCHQQLDHLPWYAPHDGHPWQVLPHACTNGEIAVARSMLKSTCERIGVEVVDFGGAVVLEDRFNRMVAATRSKAAASFTFVACHLQKIWDRFGEHDPFVVVDRQSGRTHYREPLCMMFPEATIAVESESDERSVYRMTQGNRAMSITFQVEAESQHMPVALASMLSKYTRELFMHRFNTFFTARAPQIAPTAGYATDGRRFLDEITPLLPQWSISPDQLARIS